MKLQSSITVTAVLAGLAAAEVPQEHSHRKYLIAVNELLELNNPFNILDSVFGFLGNAAAADGAGDVTNLDCLQQITADSAFTAAKEAGDIDGMTNALIFRALERNTGAVGLKSVICNETAINPEIDAISQHQDPASENAAEENKAITLALAQQLALIGADPMLALESGTFPPGEIGDPTAAGNTCNDETDDIGCIFTLGLLVPDATPEEIEAAVAQVLVEDDGNVDVVESLIPICQAIGVDLGAGQEDDDEEEEEGLVSIHPPIIIDDEVEEEAEEDAKEEVEDIEEEVDEEDEEAKEGIVEEVEEVEEVEAEDPTGTTGANIQTFTGALGGPAPPVVSSAANPARPFEVNGNSFQNAAAALSRSCAIQNNACFNAVNAGQLAESTAACTAQEDACLAAASLRKMRRNARAITYSANGRFRFARAEPRLAKRQTLDFGSCSDPSIQFATGLDGRTEATFGPAGDFDHGSALNVDIITSFICGQLASRCGADVAAVEACEDGAADASALEGQAAADAFNAALGL